MPTVEYFLVCRSVQRDVSTDEISFVNVLEDLSPEAFPHVIPGVVAVSLWNLDPGDETQDYQATLVVKVQNKPDARFPMNFAREVHRWRAIQGILEIPIEGPGKIEFEVLLNGLHGATHTVVVHPLGAREPAFNGVQSS